MKYDNARHGKRFPDAAEPETVPPIVFLTLFGMGVLFFNWVWGLVSAR